MFAKIKYISILLVICMAILCGCETCTVSLEEALTVMDATTETELPNVDDMSAATVQNYCVYICGAVAEPGVYELVSGSRIVAAVEAAGGFLPEAATEAVNLAELLKDGMQIVVPTKEEVQEAKQAALKQSDGRVNLNTASVEELCTLNGIGESRAEAILAYRLELGTFRSIEQLKDVSGIGEGLFNQIKSNIYIE